MNITNSVNQLIAQLETFKTAIPTMENRQTTDDFNTLLREASYKMNTFANQNADEEKASLDIGAALSKADQIGFNKMESQNWLADSQNIATLMSPNLREFIDATGVSSSVEREILYGVVGSNADLRDWSKIMASNNPVDAARAATKQLYNSENEYALVNHSDYGKAGFADILNDSMLSSKTLVQKSGNFAEIQAGWGNQTMAVSSSGLLLRDAGSTSDQVHQTAWLFGFDTPDWVL